jgi:hypothetical protein
MDTAEDSLQHLLDMAKRIPAWQKKKARQNQRAAVSPAGHSSARLSGRAAILVKLLDLDQPLLRAVYEKPGSMKIRHYIPAHFVGLSDDRVKQAPGQKMCRFSIWPCFISGGYSVLCGASRRSITDIFLEEFERA